MATALEGDWTPACVTPLRPAICLPVWTYTVPGRLCSRGFACTRMCPVSVARRLITETRKV